MSEEFRVYFRMYRTFYEDSSVRDTIIHNTWLTALQEADGTPAQIPNITLVSQTKYSGPVPVDDTETYWDSMSLVIVGRAYREHRAPRIITFTRLPVQISLTSDASEAINALEDISIRMRGYLVGRDYDQQDAVRYALENFPDGDLSCNCDTCAPDLDEDDLDTMYAAPRPESAVPQREEDLGEDPEASKYPWTDPATWYPEYMDE